MSDVGILFDLDGTLVDLPIDIDAVRREIADILGAAGYQGAPRPVLTALAAASRQWPAAAARAREVLDTEEVRAAREATPVPGAFEAIERCQQAGAPIAIITNNGRRCVGPALARVGVDAEAWVIVSRDDVAQPKPAPHAVVTACRRLGVGARGQRPAVMIGDSVADARAAQGARHLGWQVRSVILDGARARPDLLAGVDCKLVADLGAALDAALAGN